MSCVGNGGTAELEFTCSGCNKRKVILSSPSNDLTDIPNLSLALRVSCIAAGCRYATYDKIFRRYLGMHTVSANQYYHTLELLYEHVTSMLQDMCDEAKQQMKDMPQDHLGSWSRAVTTGDGVWLTRGRHSQNASYTIRNYLTGALLYYEHLCQRGKDSITMESLYKGTAKAAEGYGADKAFKKAFEDGMTLEAHWQDGDSTSASVAREYFPNAQIFYCSGHIAKNHEKRLTSLYSAYQFDPVAIKNDPSLKDLKCCCMNKSGKGTRHSKGCGCFSDAFTSNARRNLVQLLNNAGTDVEKFQNNILSLAKYHVRNVHEWEVHDSQGGIIKEHCHFHALTVCSCKEKCPLDNLSCDGKLYTTHNILKCPFHAKAYERECERLAELAPEIIHPELGKGSTNVLEFSHSVLTGFRSKDWSIKKLHYVVTTNMGLLQTNMSWCYQKRGAGYHWILDLYNRMHIPVFDSMPAIIRGYNEKCQKSRRHRKLEETKRKAQKALARHRGSEQTERTNWGKKQKKTHDYRDDNSTVHEYCFEKELAKKRLEPNKVSTTKRSGNQKPCDWNSDIEYEFDYSDECDIDDLLYEATLKLSLCSCDGGSIHKRTCPLNLRNKSQDVDSKNKTSLTSTSDNVESSSACNNADTSNTCTDSNDDDLIYLHTVPNENASVFGSAEPTDEWKGMAATFITKLSKKTVNLKTQRINKLDSRDIFPCIRDKIVGDGNCLFRAISKAVTGTEANHPAIRAAICEFMSLDNNTESLRTLVRSRYQSDDSDPKIAVSKYIEANKMRKNETWGTEVEIIVAATMFQITIFISCIYNDKEGRSWCNFEPMFSNGTCMARCAKIPCIYLYHVNVPKREHYDLVHLP